MAGTFLRKGPANGKGMNWRMKRLEVFSWSINRFAFSRPPGMQGPRQRDSKTAKRIPHGRRQLKPCLRGLFQQPLKLERPTIAGRASFSFHPGILL